MLPLEGWLSQAQELQLGQRSRVPHDCGAGSPLIVEHKDDGWSAYCHRCSDHGWKSKPMPTLAERMALKAAQKAADDAMVRDPRPPYPPNFDVDQWPLQARVWLYKAGLFKTDIAQLGAYFHEASGRVILPVLEQGKLVYWQGRNVGLSGHGAPKYINPQVDRKTLCPRYGSGEVIVLTEDILSAYRVGQVSEGWSLMGTKLHTPTLVRLIKEGKPVMVWLDNDPAWNNPGQHAAAVIMRSLTNVGLKCYNILTDRDPKLHSRAEIIEVINNVLRLVPTSTDEVQDGVQAADPGS